MTKEKDSALKNDIFKQIAETRKVLAIAQESLAEKSAEVNKIKAELSQLEMSADLPEDIESLAGKWFKYVDGTSVDESYKQYYYIIEDHGYKSYANGTVYRKLTVFDLSMALWESESLYDEINIYRKTDRLFEPKDFNSLIPVKLDEIKKEILKGFTKIFKVVNSKDILPEEFKPFIAQQKKTNG